VRSVRVAACSRVTHFRSRADRVRGEREPHRADTDERLRRPAIGREPVTGSERSQKKWNVRRSSVSTNARSAAESLPASSVAGRLEVAGGAAANTT
jgi:hypothetical protein